MGKKPKVKEPILALHYNRPMPGKIIKGVWPPSPFGPRYIVEFPLGQEPRRQQYAVDATEIAENTAAGREYLEAVARHNELGRFVSQVRTLLMGIERYIDLAPSPRRPRGYKVNLPPIAPAPHDAPESNMPLRKYTAVIRVTARVHRKELHHDDRGVAGKYPIDFCAPFYATRDSQESLALDVFHDQIPIKVLEDFDIEVTDITAYDEANKTSEEKFQARSKARKMQTVTSRSRRGLATPVLAKP